jgi:hypothetical protein
MASAHRVFEVLEDAKRQNLIVTYSVAQMTLEQVRHDAR